MQQFLASLIYYTVVLVIPLRETYFAFKGNANEETFSLWANYWAIFCLLGFLRSLIGFLSFQPFTFIFLLFLLWCYHSDYRGALFISQNVRNLIKSNPNVANILNTANQHLKVLNLFENDPAVSHSKSKVA